MDWAANKYGDKAQGILTSAPSAREAAMEFVNERLKPEIMGITIRGGLTFKAGQSILPSVEPISFTRHR